jgi:hypothetical protein
MPIFRVSIFKDWTGHDDLNHGLFANTYMVEATDLNDALNGPGALILGYERNVSRVGMHFARMHAVSPTPGSIGRSAFVDEFGSTTRPDETEFLPLWNVVRCDFPPVGPGRPEVKYLRLPLGEGEQSGGILTDDLIADIVTNYAAPLASLATYVTPTGDEHDPAQFSVWPLVQMRQTSWHRRTRPGFHRGYVPN